MSDPAERISILLRSGETAAAEELLPLVYDQLRQVAKRHLHRERPGQTLQATALVHEAYLRVTGSDDPGWEGRRQFFLASAEAIRRILIEKARRKNRLRHGGEMERVPLEDDAMALDPLPTDDVMALEEALDALEAANSTARDIVNCRYFAGLTDAETADILDISKRSVQRQWQFIRTFLASKLGENPA